MADLVVRGLNTQTVQRLKERAKRHGRSLQNEAKTLLEQAAGESVSEIAAILARWQERFAGRKFESSVDLIREDRER